MGIKINTFLGTIDAQQDINVEGDGIKFTGEEFTELYEKAYEAHYEHIRELDASTVKGVLIGATGVGLTWLGVTGWKRFRKSKSKGVKKLEPEQLEEMGIKTFKAEVSDADDIIKKAKKMSTKDRQQLANIINEINENKRVH